MKQTFNASMDSQPGVVLVEPVKHDVFVDAHAVPLVVADIAAVGSDLAHRGIAPLSGFSYDVAHGST